MDSLKQKWQSLSRREKNILKIGALFIIFVLMYFFLYLPFSNAFSTVQGQYQYQRDLLAWMQPRVQVLQQQTRATTTAQTINQNELLPTIDQQLKDSSFANSVKQLTQDSDSTVRVTLTTVPFDQLMDWLVQQWQSYRITVNSISVQRGSKSGLADVNLVLALAPSN